jgi:hypothetical protein
MPLSIRAPTSGFGHRAVESRTEEPGTAMDPDHHGDRAGSRCGEHQIHPERAVPHDPRVLDIGVPRATS